MRDLGKLRVLPKAFKSWPKSNKSPDLVTLVGTIKFTSTLCALRLQAYVESVLFFTAKQFDNCSKLTHASSTETNKTLKFFIKGNTCQFGHNIVESTPMLHIVLGSWKSNIICCRKCFPLLMTNFTLATYIFVI